MIKTKNSNIDYSLLLPAMIIIISSCTFLAVQPAAGKEVVDFLFSWTTTNFGWLYLSVGLICFFSMIVLAHSRIGQIKLGREDDEPEFTKASWIAMLFCAGIGISLCNWAFIEPIYIMSSPPLHIEKGTTDAIEWGAMYPLLHWGIVPWSIYLLPAIPIAYNIYVRRVPILHFSEACRPILGKRVDGIAGKLIDLIVILSIVGAVGTSLGLSVPLVSKLLNGAFGIKESFGLQMVILFLWILMIGWSVYKGLGKGIQILSNINVSLAFVLLVLVLIAGPTIFILDLMSNSIGLFLDNFFRINTWTSPISHSSFPDSWTIFYWAWWVAYAPMMGIFVARISKGRTIREFILNGVLWGSAGTCVFFIVWGGYAINLDYTKALDVVGDLSAGGIPGAVLNIVNSLPWSAFVLPLFILLCFIFLATTVDSSAYTLALVTSKSLQVTEEPTRVNRIIWTASLALVGIGLLSVGGLKTAQTSTIIVALPMIPVIFIMILSFFRMVNADFGQKMAHEPLTLNDEEAPQTAILATQNSRSEQVTEPA